MTNSKLLFYLLALLVLTGCLSPAELKIRNEAAQERRAERISALEKTADGSGGAVYLFAEMDIAYSTSRSKNLVTHAQPSTPAKWKYSQEGLVAYSTSWGEAFAVKIPLELGEKFCLINRKPTKAGYPKKKCALSIVATENKRRYLKVSNTICASCYGGKWHLNDAIIDDFFDNPSKNPADYILPTLLFSMFKEGEQMKREAIGFLLPLYKNRGYVYDKDQFYALCDLAYEKEFETFTSVEESRR